MVKETHINPTYKCNNNCIFCVEGKNPEFTEGIELPFSEVKKQLLDKRTENDTLILSGGEVTLKHDIHEIVNAASRLYDTIYIPTNGRSFANKDFLNKFLEQVEDNSSLRFLISMHGHDAETHEKHTRVKGSFDEAVKGIQNLTKAGQLVTTNTVVTKWNCKHIPEMAMLLVSSGVKFIDFTMIFPMGHALDNYDSLCPDMVETAKNIEQVIDVFDQTKFTAKGFPCCLFAEKYQENIMKKCEKSDSTCSDNCLLKRQENSFCDECIYKDNCLGVSHYYLTLYGEEEFKPILGEMNE